MMRFWSAGVAVIAASATASFALQVEPETHTFVGSKIQTNKVNESGKGYSKDKTECITAPVGKVFEAQSFLTKTVSKDNALGKQCGLKFESYQSIAPGISEPRKACLKTWVKVEGGILNIGKRAKHKCRMTYRFREKPVILNGPVKPTGRDALSVMPLLPADIRFERRERSTITFGVPLQTLNARIEPIKSGPAVVKDIRLNGWSDNSKVLKLSAKAGGVFDLKCQPNIEFTLPAARFSDFGAQVLDVSPNCKAGGFITNAINAPAEVAKAIREGAKVSIVNKIFQGSDFEAWAKDDPELMNFISQAFVQGKYCRWRSEPGLCITISWPDKSAVQSREDELLANTPKSEGPVDRARLGAALDAHFAYAKSEQIYSENGLAFPAGFRNGKVEDADMAIFGGLLCRAGIEQGCSLIQNAQDTNGRFYRSPRRVGEADLPNKATFSGDQLKGIIHYMTVSADRQRLEKFLVYLKSQPTSVPSQNLRLESGYSSCPNGPPNFTCLLIGYDWFAMRKLSENFGLQWALPTNLREIEQAYDFDIDDLVWEALITNNGYRLHLIANMAWSLKSIGVRHPSLDKTLGIIAAREPENPFFNYLILGRDKRVQRLADEQCSTVNTSEKRYDWTWQRATSTEAWKDSMGWDCVFIYKLLDSDPIPT